MKTLIYLILFNCIVLKKVSSQTFKLEAGEVQSFEFDDFNRYTSTKSHYRLRRSNGDTFKGVGHNNSLNTEIHFNVLIPDFKTPAIAFGSYKKYSNILEKKLILSTNLSNQKYSINIEDSTVFATQYFAGNYNGPTYYYTNNTSDSHLTSFRYYRHGILEQICNFDSIGDTVSLFYHKYPKYLKKEYYTLNRLRMLESSDTSQTVIKKEWWPNGILKNESLIGKTVLFKASYNSEGKIYFMQNKNQYKIWEIDGSLTDSIYINKDAKSITSIYNKKGQIKKRITITYGNSRGKRKNLFKRKSLLHIIKREQFFNKWGIVKRSKTEVLGLADLTKPTRYICGNGLRGKLFDIGPLFITPLTGVYESHVTDSLNKLIGSKVSNSNLGVYTFEVFVTDGFKVYNTKLISSPDGSNPQFTKKLNSIMNCGIILSNRYDREAFTAFSLLYTLEIKP